VRLGRTVFVYRFYPRGPTLSLQVRAVLVKRLFEPRASTVPVPPLLHCELVVQARGRPGHPCRSMTDPPSQADAPLLNDRNYTAPTCHNRILCVRVMRSLRIRLIRSLVCDRLSRLTGQGNNSRSQISSCRLVVKQRTSNPLALPAIPNSRSISPNCARAALG